MSSARAKALAAILAAVGLAGTAPRAGADVSLGKVCAIVVDDTATRQERAAAEYLRKELESRFRSAATIRASARCQPAIHVGGAALRARLVEVADLADLGPDGFLLRTVGRQVVVAGGGPAGTVYGIYELMRRMGFGFYPWEYGGGLVTFSPPPGGRLPVLDERQRPYFRHRDIGAGGDGPRYGLTIREFSLADLRFANDDPEFKPGGWINWDHTSGWLVPMTRYGDRKGLFRERNAWETGTIPTHKVGVCMCHPGAAPIAADRTLEWIGRQPERRYFAVTDGDVARPRCPKCEPTDPLPDYYTDRLLDWVNAVASAGGAKHPDKTFFTLAYLGTVKPPVNASLAPNAMVVYAPWYWSSRSSSAVGLEHPLNMIAAEESAEWTRRFPGQIGVYDYPGSYVHGTAERIREYARKDVRWIYFNGWEGDLLRWVAARMTWDPTQSTDALIEEFLVPYYGPAAPIMGEWLALFEDTIGRTGASSREFFLNDEFLTWTWSFVGNAEELAAGADVVTRSRIRTGLVEPYELLLRGLKAGRGTDVPLQEAAAGLVSLHARLRQDLVAIGASESLLRKHERDLRSTLAALGSKADAEVPIDTVLAAAGKSLAQTPLPRPAAIPAPRRLTFDATGEPKRWTIASTTADAAELRLVRERGPLRAVSGTAFDAPLTRLPAGQRGTRSVHLGSVFAERVFDRPLRIAATDSAYLHLVASTDVPASIYLRVAGQGLIRADVALHAGEQIVRIALENFRRLEGEGILTGIGVELWPQDLIYPHPPTRDLELVIASLELRAGEPEVPGLPHANRAVWMTSFRPNVTHGEDAISRAALIAGAPPAMRTRYGASRSEAFRTFTPHRVLSPLVGVVSGSDASAAAQALRAGVAERFRVSLPMVDAAAAAQVGPGNLIWIGAASRGSGLLPAADVAGLPAGGFVIRAMSGRVVIGGADPLSVAEGVERLLGSQTPRPVASPASDATTATRAAAPFLSELYADDLPFFVQGFPACTGEFEPAAAERAVGGSTAIRDPGLLLAAVRRGERALPPGMVAAAAASAENCQQVRRLARNPFAGWAP